MRNRPASLRLQVGPMLYDYPHIDLALNKRTGLADVLIGDGRDVMSTDIDLDFSHLKGDDMVKAAVEWVAAIYKVHAGLD